MIITAASDYREAARRKLPRFLFDYIDGGANTESTLRANMLDLASIALRQRVLKSVAHVSLTANLFGQLFDLPIICAPVGITGMYARRGELQVARAAVSKNIPFVLSTVSICSLDEMQPIDRKNLWFQLYVLRDRGFMMHVLQRAQTLGVKKLVFTVDMPTPGSRYRDARSGMSGPFAASRRILQAFTKPSWSWNVGLWGRPHELGNVSEYLGKPMGLTQYVDWLGQNFDPSISWSDLEWVREYWQGEMLVKGILDPEDARDAVRFGADAIVVSNHGGRQLDGVYSTAKALPQIVNAVGNDLTILADSGIRSGLDVLRMLALGAKAVMLGRPIAYALAASGQGGVEKMLDIFAKEMIVGMTLTGVRSIQDIDKTILESSLS